MKFAFTTAAIALTALLSMSAAAQTVYKCTDGNGVRIFSSEPCGKGAVESHYQAPTMAEEGARVSANCHRAASEPLAEPSTAQIDSAKAEMDAIVHSQHQGTAAENAAWKQQQQSRLDQLHASIDQHTAENGAKRAELAVAQRKALANCESNDAGRQAPR